ncbi:chorismate-binding protein [Allomuricauda taeanensis]|uniref:chorismate-binding protein n=1 Tax=Flagellimonas taeanensis TaxID=1005926 RepID=UPI002E7B91E6|nr:chorismate-binding protein [Allomuricauda taeanensis]MEE1963277.1 chorismate-binding protein [Allomuricauda taeanensis]
MHYLENKELQHLFDNVENQLKKDLPFAIYRKPQQEELVGVFQADNELWSTDFKDKGFVFAPFDLSKGAVLIRPDETVKVTHSFLKKLDRAEVALSEEGKKDHMTLVEKGIQEIGKGNLKKVVLSRKMEVSLGKSPLAIFDDLSQQYPNAFCYLFHHPEVGTWCGATPETLVKIKGGELWTMSLAATLPYEGNENPQWGSKEIEEQNMVSDYIREKLHHSMERLEIDEAKSIRAGNLWHLRSEVRGKMRPETDIQKVITTLHPTPAVCGIPTQDAMDFIMGNENYERTFYTGFLGELNLFAQNDISLFVNLRCMELNGDKATIFVGGGITSASNPLDEWIETQNKSKTMLGIL